MNIEFIYQDNRYRLFDESKIKKWIVSTILEEKKKLGSIVYEFISEEEILRVNKDFLNHDYFTDIITFDESLVNIIKGHICISPDTVFTNAKKYNESEQYELYRVIIHGVMHLCGYMDYNEKTKRLMRSKENHYLEKL